MGRTLRLLAILAAGGVMMPGYASALTANKVWMEFRKNGRYRVFVNYTVPALREFREIYVDFRKKEEAERFYFDLVRGADFFPPDPANRKFISGPGKHQPW